MAIISTKDLISAVAREGHRDVFARLPAEQQCGDLGRVCERLSINVGKVRDYIESIILTKPECLVVSPKMLSDGLRMRTFVIACIGKTN